MIRVDPFAIDGSSLIKGLHYEPEFLTPAEESALSHELAGLPLKEAEYKTSIRATSKPPPTWRSEQPW